MRQQSLFRFITIAAGLSLASVAMPGRGHDAEPAWRTGRVAVVRDPTSTALHHRSVSDGTGGAIIVWQRGPGGGIHAQRIDDAGIERWLPAAGVVLSSSGFNPAVSSTESGGVVVAWDEQRGPDRQGIHVQRVDVSGTPRWPAGGVRVGSSGSRPEVLGDGSGGAWVAWREATGSARVAHVGRFGSVTDPGLGGIRLGASVASPGDMRLVPDGRGGAIAIWSDDTDGGRILAQQLPVTPVWGAAPRVVSAETGRSMERVDAVSDGAGGVLISWSAEAGVPQVRAQRLDAFGEALWRSGGVVVADARVPGGDPECTARDLRAGIAPDGSGGAIVAWSDCRSAVVGDPRTSLFARRVDASGALLWSRRGVLLTDDAGSGTSPAIVADGVGGALVTYEQVVTNAAGDSGTEIAVARLDEDGNPRWNRRVYDDSRSERSYDQAAPRIVFDEFGPVTPSAIVSWRDDEAGDLYAAKLRIASPSNDVCAQAIDLSPGAHAGTLVDGTLDGGSSCGGEISDVWYRVVSPGDGTILVDTCGTNDIGGTDGGVDTILSLHSACPDAGVNYELTCNDDWPSSADSLACSGIDLGGFFGDSYVEKPVLLGEPVLVRVSRFPDEVDGPFQLRVRFVPAPGPNDACRDATDISEGSFVGTLVGATVDGEATCNDPPGPDLWYRFTSAADGFAFIDTCGSNDLPGEDLGVDTVISVHSACPQGPNSNEIPGACNDDWFFGNTPTACDGIDLSADLDSALSLDVAAAQVYLIRVSRYAGTIDAEFRLNVSTLYDPAGYVPDGSAIPGNPLRVTRLVDDSVRLSWAPSCMISDTDFAVYEGILGSFSTHQWATCSTGGATQWDLPPQAGSQYFLVVPRNGTREGSHGFRRGPDGALFERPEAGVACFARSIGSCP